MHAPPVAEIFFLALSKLHAAGSKRTPPPTIAPRNNFTHRKEILMHIIIPFLESSIESKL
jgi:hypothetical protein